MKILKKIMVALLCVGVLTTGISFSSLAANGRISFSDPSTAVGEMVDVKVIVKSSGGELGDTSVTLAYDPSALRFDSGDGAAASGDGSITLTDNGGNDEKSFKLTFQALAEGQTKITVSGQDIKSASGSSWKLDEGNSTVKIAEGDPSKIVQPEAPAEAEAAPMAAGGNATVEVNGQSYTLGNDFADMEIPAGYSRTVVNYEGADWNMVTNEANTVYLAFLINAEGTGEFFLYDDSNATFVPYEQIDISDTVSIILLSDSTLKLPDNYILTTLTLNGKDFPVWQNTSKDGFYVMYAIDGSGSKSFYQYDSQENTYQRYEMEQVEEKKDEKAANTIFDKIQKFMDKHFKLCAIVIAALFLLILLRLLVVRVKLRNRDIELDDLYDEYGIDMEDEEPAPKKKEKNKKDKGGKKKSKRKVDEDDFDDYEPDDDDEEIYGDDLFDEEDEESYYEDDDDDEDDEEYFKESTSAPLRTVKFNDFDTVDLGLESFDDDEYESGYDDDETIDDLDELLSQRPKAKRSHAEKDDAFKVDFVDLD